LPHGDANGNRDSHADGNSDADSDTNTDRDADSNSDVYSDSHAYLNAHTDANGYGHRHSDIHAHSDGDCHSYANTDAYCDSNSYGDLNAHANCGEAFADAETASNDTATASVARIDKWNFSGGNSRVTLASSRSLRAITWIPFARADATWIALNADNSPAKPLFPMR